VLIARFFFPGVIVCNVASPPYYRFLRHLLPIQSRECAECDAISPSRSLHDSDKYHFQLPSGGKWIENPHNYYSRLIDFMSVSSTARHFGTECTLHRTPTWIQGSILCESAGRASARLCGPAGICGGGIASRQYHQRAGMHLCSEEWRTQQPRRRVQCSQRFGR
jgi:hypothetical protein